MAVIRCCVLSVIKAFVGIVFKRLLATHILAKTPNVEISLELLLEMNLKVCKSLRIIIKNLLKKYTKTNLSPLVIPMTFAFVLNVQVLTTEMAH